MTENTPPYGRYMTIPKLAVELGVSDATTRRYIKNYPQFFKSIEIDGWEQYPVEKTLKILRRIRDVSSAGQRKSEVLQILLKEFTAEIVEEIEDEEFESESRMSGGIFEFGPKTLAVLIDIRDSLRTIAEKTA